jgi:cytochrome c2
VDVAVGGGAVGPDGDVTAPPRPRADKAALLVVSVALLCAAGAAALKEVSPPWKAVRDDVRRRVAARVGAERAARLVPEGLPQLWIPALERADRCVACHPLTEGPDELVGLPVPAAPHPYPALMATHPPERFGCTVCHGGQGAATTMAAAHGDGEHATDPLVTTARARRHGLTRAEAMEGKCNACHRGDPKVAGMPLLDAAKALVDAKRCRSCHAIEGRGGTKGPDLSRVGEGRPEHLAFPSPWTRPRTALAWHAAHLAEPTALVPGSEMEVPGGLTERDAIALAVLVRSWTSFAPPASLAPEAVRRARAVGGGPADGR